MNNVRILRPQKQTKVSIGRLVLLGVTSYFVIWSLYPITDRMEKGEELAALKGQLEEINRQNQDYKKEIKYLRSDDYVEQEARSLGLSRPDEEVIVVIPQESQKPLDKKEGGGREEKKENPSPAPLWQKLTNVFSSIF